MNRPITKFMPICDYLSDFRLNFLLSLVHDFTATVR